MKAVKSLKLKKSPGFTIIELMVAISLFLILIDITSAVFIRSLRTQRIAVAQISANSNAAFVIEQMTREIRTGEKFCTVPNIPPDQCSGTKLTFQTTAGKAVTYEYPATQPTQRGYILRSESGGSSLPITAENVNIKKLSFVVFGNEPGSKYDPRITIVMQVGATGIPFEASVANLQSTVSVRVTTPR